MADNLSNVNILDLKSGVYKAARDGRADIILDLLADLKNNHDEAIILEVVNHHTQDGEQNTTPLIIAAKNGRTEVVKILLENFHADTEDTGVVTFSGEKFEDNTALCCAVVACQLDIVKLLLEHGANITHKGSNNVTPLVMACNIGVIDMVELLLNHVKDENLSQHYKNIGLRVACSRAHYWLMEYLIKVGADLNYQFDEGYTVLHIAAYKNIIDLVKIFTENGAVMKKNNYGVTPLNTAAALGYVYVVECMLDNFECTRQEKVDVLELLGASCINYDNYNIAQCYEYFEKAMKERCINGDEILVKEILPPVHVYDNKLECTTLENLQAIQNDPLALCMESLAARKRILGHDPLVGNLLVKTSKSFYDQGLYERCVALLLHALKHMQNIEWTFDLEGFVKTFDKMHQLGQTIDLEKLVEVFQYATLEIQLEKKHISINGKLPGVQTTNHFIYLQENIENCICMIIFMLWQAKTKAQKDEIYKAIKKFVQLEAVLKNGFTPLHMCCDIAILDRVVKMTESNTWTHPLPFPQLCKTFIDCGADINALDNNKNTPLHILAKSHSGTGMIAYRYLQESLTLLLENGAHIDSVNATGKTAMDIATTKDARTVIRKYMEIPVQLRCLAAKTIKGHGVQYQGILPSSLQNFVELH